MNRLRNAMAAVAIFAAVAVSACAIGPGRQTELSDNLASACLQSETSYESHDNKCIIRGCPAAEAKKSKDLRNSAIALCSTNNEGNKNQVLAIVAEQKKLGRKQ